MTTCALLGDELTLLGFRLAGVECHTPRAGEATALLRRLAARVDLLLITAEVAAEVPRPLLVRLLRQEWPLILVIPDVRRRAAPPDLVAELRRQLGMAE